MHVAPDSSEFQPFIDSPPTFQISWGTKQDTVVEEDLGAVIQNSASQVDVEVLADIADVNALYEESLLNLKDRKPVVKNPSSNLSAEREQAVRDYYASVRTNVCSAV